MGDERNLVAPQRGGWALFECFYIPFENRPTHYRCKRCGTVIGASLSEPHTSVYGWTISLYVRTSVRTHIPHMRLCFKYAHVTPYHACVRIQGASMANRQLLVNCKEPSTRRRRVAEDAIGVRVLAR